MNTLACNYNTLYENLVFHQLIHVTLEYIAPTDIAGINLRLSLTGNADF